MIVRLVVDCYQGGVDDNAQGWSELLDLKAVLFEIRAANEDWYLLY